MRTVYGDCARARQWASAEIDGELSEFERVLLHAHLEVCPACAAFLVEAQGLTHALRSAPPEHFQVGIEPRRRPRVRLRLSPVAASLAVVAVGVGSIVGAVRAWQPRATGRQPQLASETFGSGPMNMRREHGAWAPGADGVRAQQQQQQPSHGPALHP